MPVPNTGKTEYIRVSPLDYRFLRLVWPGITMPRCFDRLAIMRALGCTGFSVLLARVCQAGLLRKLSYGVYDRTTACAICCTDPRTGQSMQCDLRLLSPAQGIEQYFQVEDKEDRIRLQKSAEKIPELTWGEMLVAIYAYPKLHFNRYSVIRIAEIAESTGVDKVEIASYVPGLVDKRVLAKERCMHRRGLFEVRLGYDQKPLTISKRTIQPGEQVDLTDLTKIAA